MLIKKYMNLIAGCVGVLAVIVGCIGCTTDGGEDYDRRGVGGIPTTSKETVTEEVSKRYNAEEVVIITSVDIGNGSITVKKPSESAESILSYNGGTVIKTKHGSQLTMEEVKVGDIAKACYVSGTQKLIELIQYDGAWENTSVIRWDVDYDRKLITIGSDTYSYDDNLFITSNGKNIDIREISGIDELTVRGIDKKVYSVVVDKGHGFVKLTDTTNYVGGIIEIGDRISTVIVDDMIIAAPEGNFKLTATIKGVGGDKDINVIRGQETVVSLGSFEQAVTRYGAVKLNILPEDAQATLLVDGVETDYSELLSIPYGRHTLKVTSNNYDEVTKQITISSVYATININMAGEETTTGEGSVDEPTTEDVNIPEVTTSAAQGNTGGNHNLVCITAPLGAKVYFDSAYVGNSPVSFNKVPGEHTIIFKRDGYMTKSYTIDVSDDTEDMILSFPEMMEAQ